MPVRGELYDGEGSVQCREHGIFVAQVFLSIGHVVGDLENLNRSALGVADRKIRGFQPQSVAVFGNSAECPVLGLASGKLSPELDIGGVCDCRLAAEQPVVLSSDF